MSAPASNGALSLADQMTLSLVNAAIKMAMMLSTLFFSCSRYSLCVHRLGSMEHMSEKCEYEGAIIFVLVQEQCQDIGHSSAVFASAAPGEVPVAAVIVHQAEGSHGSKKCFG